MVSQQPPRPLAPGDIVATHSELLGAWTAAQITAVDSEDGYVSVLELDWSGAEPMSVQEFGDVAPLVLTHHHHAGRLSYANHGCVLPKSYKVVGALPLLHDEPSNSYAGSWSVGYQLFLQRRWDGGEESAWRDDTVLNLNGGQLTAMLGTLDGAPDPGIRSLAANGVKEVDCERLVERFPNLIRLALSGDMGRVANAGRLGELSQLRRLSLNDLFGMTADESVRPDRLPALEALSLRNIPAEYAAAMRQVWEPEESQGTEVVISLPRGAEWFAENTDNPLRDWDGDVHIPEETYRESMEQFRKTQRAVLEILAADGTEAVASRLTELGAEYGERFNELDETSGFIETVEREDLYDALGHIVRQAEAAVGAELKWALEALTDGVDSVRDW
jgi:hypothetical protein